MINLALIGAGYWGKNVVRTFHAASGATLHTVVDQDEQRLKKVQADYPGVQTATDAATVLNNPDIDAIVIVTPPPTHHALAKAALEKGKHVYVEKPFTLNADDAAELVALADRVGRKLMVGHLMEYHSAINWLKDYIAAGEMGAIRYIYTQRVNLGIVRSNENALWSLAPHDISIILYLLGAEPTTVSAMGQCYIQPGVEDVVFASLCFPDNRMAQIHVSWLDPHKERKLTIVGEKRMVVFDDMAPTEKIKIFDKSIHADQEFSSFSEYLSIRNGDINIPHIQLKEPLALECAHFIESIANDTTPRSDGRDGLRVVKILEAAEKSLRTGGAPVTLNPDGAGAKA